MSGRGKLTLLAIILSAFMIGSFFTMGISGSHDNSAFPESTPHNTLNPLSTRNISSNLSYINPGINSSSTSGSNGTTWESMRNKVLSRLDSLNIPSVAKLPPNYNMKPNSHNGVIYLPSYTSAPAPMGIASYGISNSTGHPQPQGYSTHSFQANVSMNSANEIYMDGDAVHTFSIQFNAVLNNVTLFGNTEYQYWTQNVVDYSTSTHKLTFLDNIWNFSSPTAVIQGNEFHSGNGTAVPGVYYYDIGPTFTVNFPFSLHLYLNTTNIAGYNTVFFNYTIINSTASGAQKINSGSFDRVEFNSTGGNPAVKASEANYTVSGTQLTGTGFIPMDAELIIGGAGGGSIAEFRNINATMTMKYIPLGRNAYRNIPSAYDVGSETGETAVGISEYYSGSVAYLNTGPSFVQGLWNISSNSGHGTISGVLKPSNGFVFINEGRSFNNGTAQWSPVSLNGSFDFQVSPGNYSMEALMSYHNPFYNSSIALNSGNHANTGVISLSPNIGRGLYTPLYASDNSQLRNLSVKGNGTSGNPFIVAGPSYNGSLQATVTQQMSPLFSQVDDYIYPVFSGILVHNTTDNSVFEGFSGKTGSPAFQVNYNRTFLKGLIESFGEVATNFLQMTFYNSSNITITNNTLSGWFSSLAYTDYTTYNIPPVANLMLWNTTRSLIERNNILSQGSGILIYNNNATNSGNYIWNNTFNDYSLISPGSLFGYAPIGIILASSGNTLYNNIFDTTIPIVSLEGTGGNLYTGQNVTYHNKFNISRENAGKYSIVNGYNLTGSAINSSYQGGNYYYNYFGSGSQPYNGSGVGLAFNGQNIFNGSINYAYDSVPLTLYGYSVTVNDTGLPSVVKGYFDINNAIYPTDTAGKVVYLPNGTYNLIGIGLISKKVEFLPVLYEGSFENPTGNFVVHGPMINMTVAYSKLYNVTVAESGLPAGTLWGFSMPQIGQGFVSTEGNVSFYIAPGTYEILPQDAYGYYATNVPQFSVTIPDEIITINYSYSNALVSTYTVTFTESGLPHGQRWTVDFNGTDYSSTTNTIQISNVSNGDYSYSVGGISGYNQVPGGIVSVNFSRNAVNVVFQSTSAIPTIGYIYIVVGTAAGLIAGAIVGVFVLKRR